MASKVWDDLSMWNVVSMALNRIEEIVTLLSCDVLCSALYLFYLLLCFFRFYHLLPYSHLFFLPWFLHNVTLHRTSPMCVRHSTCSTWTHSNCPCWKRWNTLLKSQPVSRVMFFSIFLFIFISICTQLYQSYLHHLPIFTSICSLNCPFWTTLLLFSWRLLLHFPFSFTYIVFTCMHMLKIYSVIIKILLFITFTTISCFTTYWPL